MNNVVQQLSPCWFHYGQPYTDILDTFGNGVILVNMQMGQVIASLWRDGNGIMDNILEDEIHTQVYNLPKVDYEVAWSKLWKN